jgi:exonuclease III
MTAVTIDTLNINGFTAPTRVGMLTEFLRRHDIDILFVQEVTSTEVLQIRGYETYENIGASIRGTVFLAKYGLHLENIVALPSGRAIATVYVYQGIRLINIHAPFGTAMRTERENFSTPSYLSSSIPTTNIRSLVANSTVFFTLSMHQDILTQAWLLQN